MTNRSGRYRVNPSAQRVRPVPHTEDMELQAFLNDLRRQSGNAESIKNDNGTNTPIRISGGRLQYFTEATGWQNIQGDAVTVEAEQEAEPEQETVTVTQTTGRIFPGSSNITVENNFAHLDTNEQTGSPAVTNPNYGKLVAEELTVHTHTKSEITDFAHTHTKSEITDFSHTHTKSEITDFPTGVSGTFEINGYNYTFTNGILTAREAVNNG